MRRASVVAGDLEAAAHRSQQAALRDDLAEAQQRQAAVELQNETLRQQLMEQQKRVEGMVSQVQAQDERTAFIVDTVQVWGMRQQVTCGESSRRPAKRTPSVNGA